MKAIKFYIFGVLSGSIFTIFCIFYNLQVERSHESLRTNYNLLCAEKNSPKLNATKVSTNETARVLYSQVKVLCWVVTSPQTLYSKAIHVKETWGKRCNKIIFFSSKANKRFPTIGLPVGEGRSQLFNKTLKALHYLWQHHQNDADWFLKADDDTFVIVENLRYLLKDYNPNEALYFGHRFKIDHLRQGYMSGGAGYVLSKQSLKRFIAAIKFHKCPIEESAEDVLLGMCLEAVGVKAIDTRDHLFKQRFFPFQPKYHLIPNLLMTNSWFYKYSYYNASACTDCCSKLAISFHYIKPEMMYVYYYFAYQLDTFGINKLYKMEYEV